MFWSSICISNRTENLWVSVLKETTSKDIWLGLKLCLYFDECSQSSLHSSRLILISLCFWHHDHRCTTLKASIISSFRLLKWKLHQWRMEFVAFCVVSSLNFVKSHIAGCKQYFFSLDYLKCLILLNKKLKNFILDS